MLGSLRLILGQSIYLTVVSLIIFLIVFYWRLRRIFLRCAGANCRAAGEKFPGRCGAGKKTGRDWPWPRAETRRGRGAFPPGRFSENFDGRGR